MAVFVAIGFGISTQVLAGTVNVEPTADASCDDTNRNSSVIDNDTEAVRVWITQAKKHESTENLVSLYQDGVLLGSVCPTFTQCPEKYDQFWYADVSFLGLSQNAVGNVKVVVTVGCVDGKVYGAQTVGLID